MTTETGELEAIESFWRRYTAKLEGQLQQQTRIEMVTGVDNMGNRRALSIERITMTANGTRIEVSI